MKHVSSLLSGTFLFISLMGSACDLPTTSESSSLYTISALQGTWIGSYATCTPSNSNCSWIFYIDSTTIKRSCGCMDPYGRIDFFPHDTSSAAIHHDSLVLTFRDSLVSYHLSKSFDTLKLSNSNSCAWLIPYNL